MSIEAGGKPGDSGANQAERLLRALYEQRIELGEIASELISLLKAAGVSGPGGPDTRRGDSPPE